jgi:F0F1-type ATP synthase epsilon subunit
MKNVLNLTVRTPQQITLQTGARSLRVLTESGQVGLRPRMEATVLAIEPGLMLVQQTDSLLFVGTAGGLLNCDGVNAVLLTPLAVAAEDESRVLEELEMQLAHPKAELEVRSMINNIQSSILDELKDDRRRRSAMQGRRV